ncbi:hypothetical protein [Paenibacillus sp. EZ-K15]|uniref:hypothetical protein n=1 Tax=Paenibacillus sp. EZ-K15 TaxID=2044275 RepID=UPI000BF4339A|nr:hypothetical protein [Paenibacillus sp. EZ-K15]
MHPCSIMKGCCRTCPVCGKACRPIHGKSDYLLNPDTPLPHMSSVKEIRQSVDQAYQGIEPTNTPMPMH